MFDPEKSRSTSGGWIEWSARRPRQPGDDIMDRLSVRSPAPRDVESALDSHDAKALHARLMGHYQRELERQAENRMQMAVDEDFYDHRQYSDEDLAILAERGQAALTFNLIQTSVNWLIGIERRTKKDFRILPRKRDGQQAAERKTQLLFHVRDENRSDFEWSDAFASAVKTGLGWMECARGNPDDGTILYERAENWRAMLWDSTAIRYDLQDARYVSRTKWVDLDLAASLWWNRRGLLETSARSQTLGVSTVDALGDDVMDAIELEHFQAIGRSHGRDAVAAVRDRVRIIEMWFRMPVEAKIMRGGQFHGELFDEWSPGHVSDLIAERATLATRPMQVVHVALMTDAGFLDVRRSPYRHNRFPFTPVWGYRRARDGMPYGVIRGIRDPQRDFNRRFSKALHHLSAKTVLVEQGAVDDIETLRNEAARPDAVIEYKPGRPPPAIQADLAVGQAHVELMEIDRRLIQQVGGVTDENLGRKTNATSGIAIQRRQEQGALATDLFFDNLRRSRLAQGEKLLVLIEQYYSEADEIRVIDSRGNTQFAPINDGAPENAIAAHKADFVISEEEWRVSARQSQAALILELAQQLAATAPQLVIGILDLVVEMLDVPRGSELVKRIRQITGAADPDADPNNPDPETVAMQAQKAAQDQMQQRRAEAEIAEKEGRAAKALADARKVEQSLSADRIAELTAALEAAIRIAGAPAVAAATDRVLMEARVAAGQSPDPAAAAMAQAAAPPLPLSQ